MSFGCYCSVTIYDQTVVISVKKDLTSSYFSFSNSPDVAKNPPWYAGEKYAEKARPSIIKILDEPSISNTQALLLLSMHEYGCGRGPR